MIINSLIKNHNIFDIFDKIYQNLFKLSNHKTIKKLNLKKFKKSDKSNQTNLVLSYWNHQINSMQQNSDISYFSKLKYPPQKLSDYILFVQIHNAYHFYSDQKIKAICNKKDISVLQSNAFYILIRITNCFVKELFNIIDKTMDENLNLFPINQDTQIYFELIKISKFNKQFLELLEEQLDIIIGTKEEFSRFFRESYRIILSYNENVKLFFKLMTQQNFILGFETDEIESIRKLLMNNINEYLLNNTQIFYNYTEIIYQKIICYVSKLLPIGNQILELCNQNELNDEEKK